jgi:predicted GNAT superfamily acetyltransferase
VDPGADYASENYRYFEARDTDSLYIDRIVVGEEQRGSGLGRVLYGAVFERAREDGRTEVTCEVNIEPPNPESLAFHDRMGFKRVGTQSTKGGAIVVALLAAPVGANV